MTMLRNFKDIVKPLRTNAFEAVMEKALAYVDKAKDKDAASEFRKPTLVMVNAKSLPLISMRNAHATVMANACGDDPEHRLVVAFYGLNWSRVVMFLQEVLPEGFTCSHPHVHFDGSGKDRKEPSYTLFVSKTPVSGVGKGEITRRNAAWARRSHSKTSAVTYSDAHAFVSTAYQQDKCDLGLLDAIRCRTRPNDVVWVINEHKDLLSGAGVAAASLHCRQAPAHLLCLAHWRALKNSIFISLPQGACHRESGS